MSIKSIRLIGIVLIMLGMSFFCYPAHNSRGEQAVRDVVAGGVAGAVEGVTGRPLDFTKNRLQQEDTIVKILKTMVQEPRRVYSGFALNSFGSGAATAALAVLKSQLVCGIVPAGQQPTVGQGMTIAGVAGLASGVFVGPMNATTLYMQNRGGGLVNALRHAPKMAGIGAVIPREGVWGAGFFGLYPWVRALLKRKINNELATAVGASLGTAVPLVAASHPFDTVATMVQSARCPKLNAPPLPYAHVRTEWDAVRYLAHNGGLKAAYAGGAARTVRIAVAVPVMGATYDGVVKALSSKSS